MGQHLSDSRANRGECVGDTQSDFNQFMEADTNSNIHKPDLCQDVPKPGLFTAPSQMFPSISQGQGGHRATYVCRNMLRGIVVF